MYDLENVSVGYDDTPVLEDICLRIREGEKVVIIGTSGAGKSTLLKKLYALRPSQSAFIHQDYALIPQLSAFHNVYAGRLDHNSVAQNLLNLIRPRKGDVSRITPVFRAIGMEDKMFARVDTLSGGQQQRIAVGRAIYRDSSIILGDEPVSAIDPHQAGALLDAIKKSADTVVLAMHDVQLALATFPRIIGLRQGRVVLDLPSEEVGEDTLVELYRRD